MIIAIANLAWLCGLALPSGPVPAQDATAQAEQAAERLFARRDIQFALPGWDRASDSAEREPTGDWQIEERDISQGETWRFPTTDELPPFWSLLVWMTAICCLFLLISWLLDSWTGFAWPGTDRQSGEPPEPGPLRAAGRSEPVLDEAERLASDGRFADAIHALLLHGLRILRRRLGTKIAAALTSREILALSDLPETGHAALRDLVAWVELTYFGERAATAEDYLTCRGLFEDFAQSMRAAR